MRDDIISRLRELAKPGTSLEDVGGASVFTEAAAEIASLRLAIRRLADQDATLSVCKGGVTVEMDATPEILDQFSQQGGQLVPFDPPMLRLTDEERLAVSAAVATAQEAVDKKLLGWENDAATASTLRDLLERTGGER